MQERDEYKNKYEQYKQQIQDYQERFRFFEDYQNLPPPDLVKASKTYEEKVRQQEFTISKLEKDLSECASERDRLKNLLMKSNQNQNPNQQSSLNPSVSVKSGIDVQQKTSNDPPQNMALQNNREMMELEISKRVELGIKAEREKFEQAERNLKHQLQQVQENQKEVIRVLSSKNPGLGLNAIILNKLRLRNALLVTCYEHLYAVLAPTSYDQKNPLRILRRSKPKDDGKDDKRRNLNGEDEDEDDQEDEDMMDIQGINEIIGMDEDDFTGIREEILLMLRQITNTYNLFTSRSHALHQSFFTSLTPIQSQLEEKCAEINLLQQKISLMEYKIRQFLEAKNPNNSSNRDIGSQKDDEWKKTYELIKTETKKMLKALTSTDVQLIKLHALHLWNYFAEEDGEPRENESGMFDSIPSLNADLQIQNEKLRRKIEKMKKGLHHRNELIGKALERFQKEGLSSEVLYADSNQNTKKKLYITPKSENYSQVN